jgi:hypothetical protein
MEYLKGCSVKKLQLANLDRSLLSCGISSAARVFMEMQVTNPKLIVATVAIISLG